MREFEIAEGVSGMVSLCSQQHCLGCSETGIADVAKLLCEQNQERKVVPILFTLVSNTVRLYQLSKTLKGRSPRKVY